MSMTTSSAEQSTTTSAPPDLEDNTLVTSESDGDTYLVSGGKRQLVTNVSALFAAGIDPRSARSVTMPAAQLKQVPFAEDSPLATLVGTHQVDTGDVFLGAGHYMHTWGTISGTGQIAMQTRTRSVTWLGGYHGAVRLIAADQYGAPTFQSQDHRYGVDGTMVGTSDRTDAWWETMSADAFNRTTQVAIFHSWDPNSFQTILDQWVQTAKKIGDLVTSVAGIAKVFTTILK
jgi:hypothetical protein